MFDIGASELLVIVIVAILVIGPKDMPMALRTAGRWFGKIRSVSNHFRAGIDAMIREAELEEMEKKWQEQNKKIMAEHPDAEMTELEKSPPAPDPAGEDPAPENAVDTPPPQPEAEPSPPLDEPKKG
jgi:sec-independent protein translocase protein TatB